ncbi:hypothetical protein B0H11DRAFT_1916958 [Mycena galericulata]|nr:hypothetical protein B0H11DRAFT_1916958 [Mycena galericulata]
MYPRLCSTRSELWIIGVWIQYNFTRVTLNPMIQSSDWIPPKADTWTGRNWQGGAQSNNPEFGSGTTEGGYMNWMQLSSDRVLPKADTGAGRNWQGGTQSYNPEFGLGTTESGYRGWTQLARHPIP